MKKLAVIAFALCNVTALAEGPFGDMSFEDACAAAKKDNKVVLIDFYTTWCGPCKKLDQTTWKDPEVRAWLEKKCVALKLDAEKQVKLAEKYHISAYPTIILIKADGTEIDRLVGFRDAKPFIEEADAALSGKNSITRAQDKMKGDAASSPMLRMNLARAYADKGQHAEALKEYLWCFDEGNEHMSGFTGVRLSFLLSDIGRLARQYPPALDALKSRRDKAEQALMKSKAAASQPKSGMAKWFGGRARDPEFESASDFAALNDALGDNARTLTMFDKLCRQSSRQTACKALFRHVFDDLLKARRYDDIMKGCGDPAQSIGWMVDASKGKGMFGGHDADMKKYYKAQVVVEGGKYYEVLLGVHKPEAAAAMAEKVLDVDGSARVYASLVVHARRANDKTAADGLIAEASKKFDKDEVTEIKGEAEQSQTDE